MAKDLHDLARTAAALPGELQDAQVRGVNRAALAVTRSIRDQIRSATGGDMRLSGVGRRGARVGARYDVRGRVNPTAIVRATGPLQLIDRDTAPHEIGARGQRVGKRGRRLKGARALKLPGGFASRVEHPGTRGKGVWARGVSRSAGDTRRIFGDEVHKAVLKAVKG